jgi:hypothetical protein
MSFIVSAIKRASGKLQAREIGTYPTFDEAVRVAKQHIDDFIYREYKRSIGAGITVTKLFERYKADGELMIVQPKVKSDTVALSFDAYDYASRKCAEIASQVPPLTRKP